ncbi:hypothetical protein RMSM_07232 [Rhodopirellula maiorica SM1]|uniref:Uncharacterized protein n=1 Tax=Rhodopirellula maiorica SM1 TaxID=1265738 RepID=M5R8P1_9BACT|nr:hypothetical protein RMSM_07232 [Rhodopirellula maiorica SM1]
MPSYGIPSSCPLHFPAKPVTNVFFDATPPLFQFEVKSVTAKSAIGTEFTPTFLPT